MSARFMSGRVVAFLVLLSAASLLALLVLVAFAPEMRAGNSSGSDAVSRSAVGFAGLKQLLALSDIPAIIDRGPIGRAAGKPSLTILTPDMQTSGRDLAGYERSGPVLVILPKWEVVPIPLKTDWVMKAGALPEAILAQQIAPLAGKVTIARFPGSAHNLTLVPGAKVLAGTVSLPAGNIDEVQTIGGLPAVLTAPNYGPLLSAVRGKGYPLYILAEPDLMNNHGLADEARARAAVAIIRSLRQGSGPVAIDVTLNGLGRSPSLLRALFEPPFLGATLCALVAALLMGLHIMSRFGAPLEAGRVFARGKKALADNTADLIRMMGREAAMAQGYVASARNLALTRLGAARAAPAEQDALLAAIERSGGVTESYAALAGEAAAAKNSADLIRIAKKTYSWRRGVTGGY